MKQLYLVFFLILYATASSLQAQTIYMGSFEEFQNQLQANKMVLLIFDHEGRSAEKAQEIIQSDENLKAIMDHEFYTYYFEDINPQQLQQARTFKVYEYPSALVCNAKFEEQARLSNFENLAELKSFLSKFLQQEEKLQKIDLAGGAPPQPISPTTYRNEVSSLGILSQSRSLHAASGKEEYTKPDMEGPHRSSDEKLKPSRTVSVIHLELPGFEQNSPLKIENKQSFGIIVYSGNDENAMKQKLAQMKSYPDATWVYAEDHNPYTRYMIVLGNYDTKEIAEETASIIQSEFNWETAVLDWALLLD